MTRSLVLMCTLTSGCILHRERSTSEPQFEWTHSETYDCPHARDTHNERCEDGGGSHADKETVP
jgi:hypothetical protein